MPVLTRDNIQQWRGATVVDRDGDRLGKVEEVFLDVETDQPEWILVNLGLFGARQTFVPVAKADLRSDSVVLPYEKSFVKDAPDVEAGRELSQDDESRLYEYYGLQYSESRSGTGLPEGDGGTGAEMSPKGRDVSGPRTDDAMTRSEEELRVGTQRVEAGRVRLRKYVTTENVSETVPVQREEVRVEREPITEANIGQAMSGPELSEEEHELVLTEEQVQVDKQVVPKERIRLDKETVHEQQTVTEELRKEQIDFEGGGPGTRGS